MDKKSFKIFKYYFNKNYDKKITQLFNYNLTGSKNLRSLFMAQKDKNVNLISVCIEALQAYFLITDDIIDKSEYRRGKPCWYKVVKKRATSDAFFLLSCIYKTISEYEYIIGMQSKNTKITKNVLENKEKIMECFYKANFITLLGQTEDSLPKKIETYNDILNVYNLENYKLILTNKTSHYTTILPIQLRCLIYNYEYTEEMNQFCKLVGFYMQFQDDYLNFFPQFSGKSGTDIQEKKITWYTCKLAREQNIIEKYLLEDDFKIAELEIKKYLEKYEEEEEMFMSMLKEYSHLPDYKFIIDSIYKRKN